MKKNYFFLLFLVIISFEIQSQAPKKPNPNEIHQSIQKLNFLGSVLYLAAHPDDENTRLISYFENQVHARTAYLSLTRGDGGQNLIGPEIRELLGLIRTNELLKAREVDGGEQFFSRANDFGYSKHPDETLRIWNKEEVLSDVVRVIRIFQPDIIINRFNAESAGKTHGHHTSSAMISTEAFDLAGDKDFKTQNLNPWKAKRLFFNTSWWFYGSKEKFEKADKSNMISLNTGVYFPNSGLSNTEIASLSRSMHKSQGFGSTGSRGEQLEYINLLKGEMPRDPNNLFEGIDTSWSRVKGGAQIEIILESVEKDFDFRDPSASIPDLIRAYDLIEKLEDKYWRDYKSEQIREIIAACAGLYLEVKANEPFATRNSSVKYSIEAINRSKQNMTLEFYTVVDGLNSNKINVNSKLDFNSKISLDGNIEIPAKIPYTSPYWLDKKGDLGMYKVSEEQNIGLALTKRSIKVIFELNINGSIIPFERDIIYKYNDPVKGEVYQPFEIVPRVTSSIASQVIIFNDNTPKEIPVKIRSLSDGLKGEIQLEIPVNWKVSPASIPVGILEKGEVKTVVFTITPASKQSEGYISSRIKSDGEYYTKSLVEINYDHIPKQMVLMPAEAKVVRLDLVKMGKRIAYIKGAGDQVPQSLQQIGYQVTEIDPKSISSSELEKFDAVILGIRAYNIVDELKYKQSVILDYVNQGGNVIVQYNTSHRLKVKDDLAPYTLQLSRDRVTDENAEVKILSPNHELMNYPNKITKKDFEGWVQERGLYFPNKWSEEFTPVLSIHDKGESPKEGSLLVAKYGKGYYIYTGLSFFRELPAGVPGAYKLFTNMISIGKNEIEKDLKE